MLDAGSIDERVGGWLQEALYVQGEALGLDEETVRDALEAFDGDYAVRHTSKPVEITSVVMMSRSVTTKS